ncbi:hypothetical protein [Nocardioides jejuensis]|uniref:Uncharacterized protein n=1 Tax=Nocardioides jejuensis TaxID=2502782 RepID=A0A4V2NZ80_9ACTN|nr:hypothetical protein [Nocardioides jejuensis]TCJ20827.1 hypothetical protein EPD65_16080 [Nocardioides jejuensis]TCJ23006.1 hypothetical protein EPD65_11635 [Nocardioides jejuensis]TCJ28022.1 hypothetical protein EPD65_08510 [Nocardioides jejuensis]
MIVFAQGDGYGFGVVEGATGECLAWDGLYYDESLPTTTPLDQIQWDEWDDMSSKLVFNTQRDWFAGPLGEWMMPTYSLAKEAAELVSLWGSDPKEDGRHLGGSSLRCYVPITDETAFTEYLDAAEKRREGIRARFSE